MADTTLLLGNSGGYGLLAKAGDMHGRNKGGKAFLTVDEGATILPPKVVQPSQHQVACLAADGRLLVFPLDALPEMTRGKGVRLQKYTAGGGVSDLKTFNVLEDDDVRQGIKDYSQWPTIPQLYVNGEFIGGSDIMMEMYQSGELQQTLNAG